MTGIGAYLISIIVQFLGSILIDSRRFRCRRCQDTNCGGAEDTCNVAESGLWNDAPTQCYFSVWFGPKAADAGKLASEVIYLIAFKKKSVPTSAPLLHPHSLEPRAFVAGPRTLNRRLAKLLNRSKSAICGEDPNGSCSRSPQAQKSPENAC